MSDKETAPSMEVLELRAELAEEHSAIINLTAEWHRAEIALDKARREAAELRRVNVIDTARGVKRALSARSVARYARRMKAERDAARAEVARLTAALEDAYTSAQMIADDPSYSGDECVIDPVAFDAHRQAIRAALRGQQAPAQGQE